MPGLSSVPVAMAQAACKSEIRLSGGSGMMDVHLFSSGTCRSPTEMPALSAPWNPGSFDGGGRFCRRFRKQAGISEAGRPGADLNSQKGSLPDAGGTSFGRMSQVKSKTFSPTDGSARRPTSPGRVRTVISHVAETRSALACPPCALSSLSQTVTCRWR